MSYGLVDGLKEAYPVSQLCGVLDVNKSSYYYWQGHRQPTTQRLRLQVHAKAVHTETRQTYGSRRMSAALKAQGLDVGRHRARSLMREAGLVAVRPKKRHSYPAGEVSRVADNHLDRQFEASKPNQKWVGDTSAPCGYHVFMDNCWLGVPRGGAGFVLAQGGRLERVRFP